MILVGRDIEPEFPFRLRKLQGLYTEAGGRALIPKNASGCSTCPPDPTEIPAGFARAGLSLFQFLFSIYSAGRSLPAARSFKARRRASSSAGVRRSWR